MRYQHHQSRNPAQPIKCWQMLGQGAVHRTLLPQP
jgi:hypothetical protein